MRTLRIRKPDDMHCHLRRGIMLRSVVGFTAKHFKRAVIMPNTDPPILTGNDAHEYQNEICACPGYDPELFLIMTIQITPKTTAKIIEQARGFGVMAGKVYPKGLTTNSENGVCNYKKIYPALAEMQKLGMPCLFHGEKNGFCLDREKFFIPIIIDIAERFPKLRIVLEHITTAAAVNVAKSFNNIFATITPHHLVLTTDDIIGDKLRPHNFCKPVAKRPEDRDCLLDVAMSGNPKFFLGTDSAPHLKERKECAEGCAGCFNAPVAITLLAQVFHERGKLHMLEDFVALFGADFYGLPYCPETIELVQEDWVVPQDYSGIVPFMAGQTLHWKVAD